MDNHNTVEQQLEIVLECMTEFDKRLVCEILPVVRGGSRAMTRLAIGDRKFRLALVEL